MPPTPAAPARPTKAPNHSAARGARLSLGLTRIVHQATELQRWISTPAAVAAPLAQAEGLIERLEAAETALSSLQSLLAGESGRPNRMSALLRQVDKENALDGARGEEKCTANVHMLLGNLSASVASSAASTAKRLASTPNALAGVPPAADAAIEQAEAALAGIVPSAPLNVRPRSSPNRRPPAMLDLDAEGGGEGPISADAAAREKGAASAAPTHGRRAGGPPTPTPGRRAHARAAAAAAVGGVGRAGGAAARPAVAQAVVYGRRAAGGSADAVAADAEAAERAALGCGDGGDGRRRVRAAAADGVAEVGAARVSGAAGGGGWECGWASGRRVIGAPRYVKRLSRSTPHTAAAARLSWAPAAALPRRRAGSRALDPRKDASDHIGDACGRAGFASVSRRGGDRAEAQIN